MTLLAFLDTAYYMLVEDAQRIPGMTLEKAIEIIGDYGQGAGSEERKQENVEAQNDASLRELQKMMMR